MEWGAKWSPIAVTALHNFGKITREIYELPKKLCISMFVYRTIFPKRLPLMTEREVFVLVSLEMGISSRLIWDDIHIKAYRRSTGRLLSSRLNQIRFNRYKRLLQSQAVNGHKSILFIDEKCFCVEEVSNKRNNIIHTNAVISRVQHGHHRAVTNSLRESLQ